MKILLTGATGFVGKALLPHLIRAEHEITLLSRQPHNGEIQEIIANKLMWAQEVHGKKFDLCIHLAWITTPGIYLDSPVNDRLADATIRLAEGLFADGLPHFLALGTCLEYAPHQILPCNENTTPISPVSTYAKSKERARLGIAEAAKRHGAGYTWARLFHLYGLGEDPNRIPSTFLRTLREGNPLLLKTPQAIKDWIEISDVTSALILLAEIETPQFEVNLGTGCGVSINALAETISSISQSNPNLIKISENPDIDLYHTHIADITKLIRAGWRPTVDINRGIQRLCSEVGLLGMMPPSVMG